MLWLRAVRQIWCYREEVTEKAVLAVADVAVETAVAATAMVGK